MKNKLIKNTIFTVLKTFASIVIPFLVFPYVSRVLNVESIGRWNYANSFISYFLLFAMFGVNEYATRNGSQIKDDVDNFERFSNNIFSVNIIFSVCSYLTLMVITLTMSFLQPYKSIILCLGFTVLLVPLSVEWIYSIFEDFQYIAIRTIAIQLTSAVLIFIFVNSPGDFYKYVGITIVASLLSTFINYSHSRKLYRPRIVLKSDFIFHVKKLSVFFSNSLASMVYLNSDVLLLGVLANDYKVGLYSAAVKIYSMVKQIFNAAVFTMIPRLSYYANEDMHEFKALLRNVISIVLIFVFPATIGLFLLSDEIILVIAGEKYLEAGKTLSILSIATFFAVFANIFANGVLVPLRKEKLVAKATIASACLNLLLNLFAIPMYSHNGAAFTTLIAELSLLGICVFQSHFFLSDVFDKKNFIDVLISTVIMTIGIIVVTNIFQHNEINIILRIFIKILISVLIYFMMLIINGNLYVKSLITKL